MPELTYVEGSKRLRTNYVQPELPFKNKRHPTDRSIRYCVWCGKQLSGRARNWCTGGKCLLEYRAQCKNWKAVRELMVRNNRERNGGILKCEGCKKSLQSHKGEYEKLHKQYDELVESRYKKGITQEELCDVECTMQEVKERIEKIRYSWKYEIDHKVAIALGGHPTDMENLCLLCMKCHKQKTADDVGKIAEIKRAKKEEEVRLSKEERLSKVFGKPSRWSCITEFEGVKDAIR